MTNQFAHITDLEELEHEANIVHSELSEAYYKRKEMTKEVFDMQHGKLWSDYEEQHEVIQPRTHKNDDELKEEYKTTNEKRKTEIIEELLELKERTVI